MSEVSGRRDWVLRGQDSMSGTQDGMGGMLGGQDGVGEC